MTYAFIQRLMFYDTRRKGSSLAVYRRDFARFCKDMGVPDDFNIRQMLDELTVYTAQELERINNLWEADVELKWVGELIPVEDISTPVDDDDEATCIVCRYSLTPPGVKTVPCGHSYCDQCLKTWYTHVHLLVISALTAALSYSRSRITCRSSLRWR
jgi:hypothetical protein